MTDLEALIERVEGLTGPDREVDGDLALSSGFAPEGAFKLRGGPDLGSLGTGPYTIYASPYFTSSVDAALAFAKKVLPNFKIKMIDADPTVSASNPDSDARAEVVPHLKSNKGWQVGIKRGRAPTPPLAIVLATLKAKAAQQAKPE